MKMDKKREFGGALIARRCWLITQNEDTFPVRRKTQIEKFLGCKFVRINQKTVNETELIKEFKKYD